jgi:hypothetical protein
VSQGVAVGGGRLAALSLLLEPAVFQGFLRQDLATRRHADAVTRLVWRANPATHHAPSPPASWGRWGDQNSDQNVSSSTYVKSRGTSPGGWRYQLSTGSWPKVSASQKPAASSQIARSATNVSSQGLGRQRTRPAGRLRRGKPVEQQRLLACRSPRLRWHSPSAKVTDARSGVPADGTTYPSEQNAASVG